MANETTNSYDNLAVDALEKYASDKGNPEGVDNVTSLDLGYRNEIVDLSPLSTHAWLRSLDLRECQELTDRTLWPTLPG
jgi:hypothetical protein